MPQNRQKGFTLLELLVVVVIIGVLAAISIPQYNRYRERTELASVLSNCRSRFRAFTLYYMEKGDNGYPSMPGDTGDINYDFHLTKFEPLIYPRNLGGMSFEIDIEQLKRNLGGNPLDRVYFTDADYQTFYLVMPWGKDPTLQFVVAASDNVLDKDGLPIDGGNWLDGVYIWHEGKIKYQ